jgi:hypothetical protein
MIIPYLAGPEKQNWFGPERPTPVVPAEEFERQKRRWNFRERLRGDKKLKRAIGGLLLREDGWAELKPAREHGRVITKQCVFEGDVLRINADCSYGCVKAEMLDPCMKPYEGFGVRDCDPIHAPEDKLWHTVSWKGRADLRSLWNKPVRICFYLNEASIYAFQFCGGDGEPRAE